MAIEERTTMHWTNSKNEAEIDGTRHQTITNGAMPDVDFRFHDPVNSTIIGIACDLARLEGDVPDPHDSEAFIRCLMA